MPEVGDPTPSEHDSVIIEPKFDYIRKKIYVTRSKDLKESVVFSRGREPPKAGMITGVKS